jgi:hypothetical protein
MMMSPRDAGSKPLPNNTSGEVVKRQERAFTKEPTGGLSAL